VAKIKTTKTAIVDIKWHIPANFQKTTSDGKEFFSKFVELEILFFVSVAKKNAFNRLSLFSGKCQ